VFVCECGLGHLDEEFVPQHAAINTQGNRHRVALFSVDYVPTEGPNRWAALLCRLTRVCTPWVRSLWCFFEAKTVTPLLVLL
jgi:hypothetical protein